MKKEDVKRKIEHIRKNIAYYSKIYSPDSKRVIELKSKLKESENYLRKLK